MHKAIACHHSPVLNKAFNGLFLEGQTQTFTIEDFKQPNAFYYIQSWMYTQQTDSWKLEYGASCPVRIFHVWILADRLLMPRLQNAVMELMHDAPCVPLRQLRVVYDNTLPESKLRNYLIDLCAIRKFSKEDKDSWLAAGVPSELLLNILIAQIRDIPPTPYNIKIEDYLVSVD